MAAQLALALLVLAAAGVITRSLINLQRAELSLDPSHLFIGELALQSDLLASPEKQRAMLKQLMPQLEAIPGVRAVSPVVAVPFSGNAGWDGKPAAEGQSQEEAAANPMLNMEVVAPELLHDSWRSGATRPCFHGSGSRRRSARRCRQSVGRAALLATGRSAREAADNGG